MTPTPEDIALAERLNHALIMDERGDVALHRQDAAQLIADHTAPLRELAEIGRLAVLKEKVWADPWAAPGAEAELERAVKAYIAKEPKP